ncbi:MAG: DUF692 family multinuclear iron-containing protein [Tistlia sp.]|uniref:multinuclear nonheme iron-dependent oxidase n=1 Tax=Tistlia sp. TaxID=3057121 RepID=UPI0034A2821F
MKLGLGVSAAEAANLLADRAEGRLPARAIDFVNIGCRADEALPERLGAGLAQAGLPVLLHAVELNLPTSVPADLLARLRAQADRLGARWVEQDLGVWLWDGMYLGAHLLNPIEDAATVTAIAENVAGCAEALGRPMMIENPPVYYRCGELDLFVMLAEVARRSGAGIVMDVGHLIGYGVNAERTAVLPPDDWPGWPQVVELHFSGSERIQVKGRDVWIDRHDMRFGDELLDCGRRIAQRVPPETLVCLELDGASPEIVDANIAAVREQVIAPAAEAARACA